VLGKADADVRQRFGSREDCLRGLHAAPRLPVFFFSGEFPEEQGPDGDDKDVAYAYLHALNDDVRAVTKYRFWCVVSLPCSSCC
jgi:hypothetical protein